MRIPPVLAGFGLSLWLTIPVQANIYVSLEGIDSADRGTKSQPFKSVSFASTKALPGDTLFVAKGTYLFSKSVTLPPGVHFVGEGIGNTILTGQFNDFLLKVSSSPVVSGNQSLSDFSIDGMGRKLFSGIEVTRHDVEIHHIKIENCRSSAMDIWSGKPAGKTTAPEVFLKGIKVHHCELINNAKIFPTYGSGALQIAHLDGADIGYITISEDQGYGIKQRPQGSWGWFKRTKVHDCNIKVNLESHGNWGSRIGIEMWNCHFDTEVFNNKINSWVSFIHGNKGEGNHSLIAYTNYLKPESDSLVAGNFELDLDDAEIRNNYINGLQTGMFIYGRYGNNLFIHNNIFSNPKPSFFHIMIRHDPQDSNGGRIQNLKIVNNVFYRSDSSSALGIKIRDALTIDGFTVQNNLFYHEIVNKGVVFTDLQKNQIKNEHWDHNFYHNVKSDYGNANLTGNPGISKTGSLFSQWFVPVSGSPLIDKGTITGLEYSGLAPDIGAFEYGQTVKLNPGKMKTGFQPTIVKLRNSHVTDLRGRIRVPITMVY